MNNSVGSLQEGAEEIGTQMKGTVTILSERYGQIIDESGKTHIFYPTILGSISTYTKDGKSGSALLADFAGYTEGANVTFYLKESGEICNVTLDTSEKSSVLVPKTENAVAGILDTTLNSPECSLENNAFRIDSTGWQDITVQDAKGNSLVVKANQTKDVCELSNGVQLFTPAAMVREAQKVGREKDLPIGNQAQWLLKNTPNNIPVGCEFAGFIDSKGRLQFAGENACYWIGETTEKGNQKALFCIDINTVDEDMRDYTDEMIISDYDMESMMQVRFVTRKS